MFRNFARLLLALFVVAAVVAGFPLTSQAEWLTAAFLGDSDCGISSAYTYTCAVDINGLPSAGTRYVNGVPFERFGRATDIDPNVPYSGSGANWNAAGFISQATASTIYTTGSIKDVVKDIFVGSADPITFTLTNLTPGWQYLFTAYNLATASTKNITVTTTLGDSYLFNESWTGNGNANIVTYSYTAPAGGSVMLTFTGGGTAPTAYRASAFSNRVLVAAPEPSGVFMAVTGFVGLLAYGWRKRR
jgi:hypothetical protein